MSIRRMHFIRNSSAGDDAEFWQAFFSGIRLGMPAEGPPEPEKKERGLTIRAAQGSPSRQTIIDLVAWRICDSQTCTRGKPAQSYNW